MEKTINLPELKIISDNCIDAGEDLYLFKAVISNDEWMIFAFKDGNGGPAFHIATLKTKENSIEKVFEMFTTDQNFMKRLEEIRDIF